MTRPFLLRKLFYENAQDSGLCASEDWQSDQAGMFGITIDSMISFDEVFFLRFKNIWHKLLRISIDEGKPAGLHLNHHPVASLESMQDIIHTEANASDFTWHKGLWLFPAFAESTPDRLPSDQQLLTPRILFG